MRATQTVNEHGVPASSGQTPATRRRCRMLICGVIVLVAAFAPTSANAVIPNSVRCRAGTADVLRCTCTARPTTPRRRDSRRLVGPRPFNLCGDKIASDPVDSPADGEHVHHELHLDIHLAAALGRARRQVPRVTTQLTQQGACAPCTPPAARPGSHVVGNPPRLRMCRSVDGTPFRSAYNKVRSLDLHATGRSAIPIVFSPGTVLDHGADGPLTIR